MNDTAEAQGHGDDTLLFLVMTIKPWSDLEGVPVGGNFPTVRFDGEPAPGLEYWCPVFDSLEAAVAYVGDSGKQIVPVREKKP